MPKRIIVRNGSLPGATHIIYKQPALADGISFLKYVPL